MEDNRTWRESLTATGPRENDDLNLYWPYGFPRDFLIYCRYFTEKSLLKKQFPWCRTPCLPSSQPSIFLTCSPLYNIDTAAPELLLEGTKERGYEDDNENEDVIIAAPSKRMLAPSYLSAGARDAARHLFAGQPPAKETRVEEQLTAIELYPKIKTAIGGIGMAYHIIKSLVSGCGSYRHSLHSSYRDGLRIASHIFGSKRHRVLFPYYKSLHHSINHQPPVVLAIQVCSSNICISTLIFHPVSGNCTRLPQIRLEPIEGAICCQDREHPLGRSNVGQWHNRRFQVIVF
jgi:hypothetical protein